MYVDPETKTVKSKSKDEVVQAILVSIQSWSDLPSIAQFAINREGYGGDWFGILYLSGLDGWNIWREGHFIPKGYVYVNVDPSVDEIKAMMKTEHVIYDLKYMLDKELADIRL